MDLPASSALLAPPLALAPGLFAWWTGRQLHARAEDPTLPEILLERRQRLTKVAVFALVLVVIVAGPHALWAVPLLLLALLVGRYPLRRALFGESWTLPQYLRYAVFDPIGTLGLWLAVGFAPAIVVAIVAAWVPTGTRQTLLAAVLGAFAGVGLLFWRRHYVAVWLRLHRATPLVDDGTPRRRDLLTRFAAVLDRAATSLHRPPTIHRYGAPGAHILNAVALPSIHSPAVAISDGLLEALAPEELAAVFAHEIAHHEHHNARRLRSQRRRALALIAATALLPAALLALDPFVAAIACWFWPLAVVLVLGRRVGRHRAHETESDLRAVALTGDPEAMARALVRLHVGARMPRRWPHEVERAATHPSLARRVQAIRGGGAAAAAALGTPTIVPSSHPGGWVALDATRAYWFDGVPDESVAASGIAALRERASSYRVAGYADLSELRVVVLGTGRALRATDRSGHVWSVPLHARDVSRVQQALDLVDVQLGGAPGSSPGAAPQLGRVLGIVVLIAMLVTGDLGVLTVPALLAALWPTGASVLALGVMTIAHTLVVAVGSDPLWATPPLHALQLLLLATGGIASTWIGWRWAREELEPGEQSARRFVHRPRFVIALLAATALCCALPLLATLDAPAASLIGEPMFAALTTVLLGIGTVLLIQQRRAPRLFGGLLVVAGVAAVGGQLLDGTVIDAGPRPSWQRTSASLVSRVEVPGTGYQLRLSPSGKRFATRQVIGGDDDARVQLRYVVGGFDPSSTGQRSFQALQAEFVDDDRLLVLADTGDSLAVSLERADPPASGGDSSGVVLWRRVLPRMIGPRLLVDRRADRWAVAGWPSASSDGSLSVVSGGTGGDSMRRFTDSGSRYGDQVLFAGADGTTLGSSLVLPTVATGTPTSLVPLLGVLGGAPFRYRWTLWRGAHGEHHELASVRGFLGCTDSDTTGAVLCTVQERGALRALRIDRGGTVSEVARVRGSYPPGRIESGLLVLATPLSSSARVVDLHTRRAFQVLLPIESGAHAFEVAAAPGLVATLTHSPLANGGHATVSLYRIRDR